MCKAYSSIVNPETLKRFFLFEADLIKLQLMKIYFSIRQIVLFHMFNFVISEYIEVKIEGLNGQLPNLDLVNLVHKLCVKSGIHHSYKNR